MLTVMEAGFRILPGKEDEFFERQAAMVPVGMEQAGFVSVYGGPILESSWLYFGVRFADPAAMDAWHFHPAHRAVQKMAYEKWWSGVYIRKWRRLAPGDAGEGRRMCETRIDTAGPLDDAGMAVVREAVAGLDAAKALAFPTVSGEFEPQPYQFVGPLQIAPRQDGASYSLITHWASQADLDGWLASPGCRQLGVLGTVQSEGFAPLEQEPTRERLAADRLQRQWVLPA